MPSQPFRTLFLCRENACRSIMAEAILRDMDDRFEVFSAGSHPAAAIDPDTRLLLGSLGHDTAPLRTKSWASFATSTAPALDFVFTVCDRTMGEICPSWPGDPITTHWSIPDPTLAQGNTAERALARCEVYQMLAQRISIFISFPLETLDRLALTNRIAALGRLRSISEGSAGYQDYSPGDTPHMTISGRSHG